MEFINMYYVEWLECYRLYKPSNPCRTIAYIDTILEAKIIANERGVRLFIENTPDYGIGYKK